MTPYQMAEETTPLINFLKTERKIIDENDQILILAITLKILNPNIEVKIVKELV